MKTKTLFYGGVVFFAVIVATVGLLPVFNSENIETVEYTPYSNQAQVDAQLASMGLVESDGVWYHPDQLEEKRIFEKMAAEGKNIPLQIGGIFTFTHYGPDKAFIISEQRIHNRVVDQGEDFIIDQVFKEGTAGETVDSDQIASLCVSAEVSFVDTSETKTASSFDSADGLSSNNCIADTSVGQSGQIATIGPLSFDAPTHVPAATTITGVGVCQGSASTPFANCADAQAASSGILFSQGNIADVTLASSESVDITYTNDFSSSGS